MNQCSYCKRVLMSVTTYWSTPGKAAKPCCGNAKCLLAAAKEHGEYVR